MDANLIIETVRRATFDPGQFVGRHENEPLPSWEKRAATVAFEPFAREIAEMAAARALTPEAVLDAWVNFERMVAYVDKEGDGPAQWFATMRQHSYKQSVEILRLKGGAL